MSTRTVSRATAKRRLLALCFLLEGLPKNQFNYGTFGEVENKGTEAGVDVLKEANVCGTTACALGWAPHLPAAKKLGIALKSTRVPGWVFGTTIASTDFYINGRKSSPERVSKKLFGLSDAAYDFLFHPEINLGCLQSPKGTATAEEVAEHIRTFVAIHYA